jgi:uncharacterized protein (DUF2141 family)
MTSRLGAALAAICCFCFASLASAGELTITVDNLRRDQGQLLLCVFSAESSDSASFPDCVKGRPVRQSKAAIKVGKAVVSYSGLKDGVYAVAVIHDENGNGEIDTNFLGIPTEGVGVSNNPFPRCAVRDQGQNRHHGQRQIHSLAAAGFAGGFRLHPSTGSG